MDTRRPDAKAEPRLEGGPPLSQEPPRSILIVDDEPMIRSICARVLEEFRVLQANSGQAALEMLDRDKVDLVLTDVMMIGMNGLDLLKTIKERNPTQAVVIMTGLIEKEVILKALRADADDFISKPLDFLQLRTTVEKVLEKVALKQELVELKRLDQLKSDFLGLISHKLKTPTTAISLFIQNLAQGIGDPADPEFRRTLDLVLQETRHLSALIQDLLDSSRLLLQEGTSRWTHDDPLAIAAAVAAGKKEEAAGKGVLVTVALGPPCPPIPLDQRKLAFALQAVLDNAIKFSRPGDTVEVRGEVREEEVKISVRDTGPGIPGDELPKVFEKFYQIDPDQTGQVRGFGLGLFYARKFIHDLNGSLRLESTPGIGTTAAFLLPRR